MVIEASALDLQGRSTPRGDYAQQQIYHRNTACQSGIKNRMPHASQQLRLGGWACCFRMRDSRASDGVLDSGFGRWDGALLLASPAMLGGLCVAATSRAAVFR